MKKSTDFGRVLLIFIITVIAGSTTCPILPHIADTGDLESDSVFSLPKGNVSKIEREEEGEQHVLLVEYIFGKLIIPAGSLEDFLCELELEAKFEPCVPVMCSKEYQRLCGEILRKDDAQNNIIKFTQLVHEYHSALREFFPEINFPSSKNQVLKHPYFEDEVETNYLGDIDEDAAAVQAGKIKKKLTKTKQWRYRD